MDESRFRPGFEIETTASDGTRSIKVVGELDSGTCVALLEEFERVVSERGADALSLDLEEVSFIDSTGMRAMIQIERIAADHGASLSVVSPPDDVTELLRTAGIAERMNLVADPARAPLAPEFSDRVNLDFEREPRAPSRARAEVREALNGRLDEADIATVVLLTSELVTNAVVHPTSTADPLVGLRIGVHEGGVRIEVEDGGDGFDPAAPKVTSPHGGRGLFLVDRCSTSWGARPMEGERGRRFCVWFEFVAGDRAATAASG
jgi:anti-sigma B factor antagonist